MARSESPLVGRRREVEALDRLLERAHCGEAVAAAVVGEPGIGKTYLLQELRRRASDAGFEVLTGRGSEFEREVPFGVVIEALDERLAGLEPATIARLGDEWLAELGAVLPSVRAGGIATALDVERYRGHHAIHAALSLVSAQRPLLVVLDDVHWADPASIELMSHLLRRGVPRSLLALAYRPGQVPRQMLRALERAGREGSLHTLELAPLSLSEASELLGDQLPAPRLEELHRDSGGVPFYLEQLVGVSGGSLARSPSVLDGEVPEHVRSAIAEELEQLAPGAHRLAQAGAVAGERVDIDLATEISDIGGPIAEAALDELTRTGLLRPTATPREFRFRHPIVRRATYESASAGRRLAFHERAAAACARRGAPLAIQAHHVERSAAIGDREAIAVLERAAQQAAHRAPAAAAQWLQSALRLLPPGAEAEPRLRLLVALADALGTMGRLRESRDVLREALSLAPQSSWAHIVGMLVRAEQALGHGEEVRSLLLDALATAEPSGVEAASLRLSLAESHLALGEWARAETLGAEVRARARALGDPALHLNATVFLAFSCSYRGAMEAAAARLEEAATAIEALNDEQLAASIEALSTLIWVEIQHELMSRATRHAERGLRVARATGQGYLVIRLLQGLASARMMQGSLAEARLASDEAVEASLLLDSDDVEALVLGVNCWIAWLQGETDTALATGEEAAEAAERMPRTLWAGLATACYGEALLEAQQYQRAREQLLAAGGPDLIDVQTYGRPHFLRVLTDVEIALGDMDAARRAAGHAEALAAALGLQASRGSARLARACVLLADDDGAGAAAAAGEAAADLAAGEWRIEAARARVVAGRALALTGDTTGAVRELEAARKEFATFGAARLGDHAAQELRALGKRTTRTGTGRLGSDRQPGGLTNREREVAELVARGYTNRQIGEALFVSPKTVETHLSHLFEKLDVPSRAGVAAAIGRWSVEGDAARDRAP